MKLMILDGNSVINRAYYGVRDLSTRTGLHTNAVYGFLNILNKLQTEEAPDALCVAFDRPEPTFRHRMYEGYKATRKGMPEELAQQLPWLKQVLAALNIPAYECPGWEADDILGTAARICAEQGWDCQIVTGDRDSLQLVDEHTQVRLVVTRQGLSTSTSYDPAVFRAEYGFAPPILVDLKSLMGDSSDNIPGVPGVGQKTATDLLLRYGSLSGVYAHLDDPEMKKSVRAKLEAGRESAEQSYVLATIRRDAPIDFAPEGNLCRAPDRPALRDLFRQLEFTRLMDRYGLNDPDPAQSAQTMVEGTCTSETVDTLDRAKELLAGYAAAGEPLPVLPFPDLSAFAVEQGDHMALYYEEALGAEAYQQVLSEVFGPAVLKLVHDAKTLFGKLLDRGIEPGGFVWDAALAGYVLDPSAGDYSLKALAGAYLGFDLAPETAWTKADREDPDTLAVWLGAWMSACSTIGALYADLPGRIREAGMERLYNEIELPLCPVLARMERRGIAVDGAGLETFGQSLAAQAAELEQQIYDYAGERFNINSPRQLGTILFDKLGLPAGKKTKTGWSTNAEVLERLQNAHPIVRAVLDYRTLTKLKSTYADGLQKAIGPDGRVHTTFQNLVTATGRLSSTDPNLQNIPVRTQLGSEFRKMFVARPGCVLVDADYSQIELRVLACVAEDEAMQQAFLSGEDFHSHTASQVFHVPMSEMTPELRRRAKAVNFGIVYGISEFSLAQDLGVSRKEAGDYIASYLDRFSGVRAYMQDIVAQGREQGYVSTLFGRRRQIRDLNSSNFNLRSAAERMALNTPIQGTAADIIKLAMLRVEQALAASGLEAKLILQIHDELIVECPEAEAEQVAALLTAQMEGVAQLPVPLVAEAGWGESWAAAK